jgi:hypothetical protein
MAIVAIRGFGLGAALVFANTATELKNAKTDIDECTISNPNYPDC